MTDEQLRRIVDQHAREMIGEAIRRARATEGMTQARLAELIGEPVDTVIAYENGELVEPGNLRPLYYALPTLIDEMLKLAREQRRMQ